MFVFSSVVHSLRLLYVGFLLFFFFNVGVLVNNLFSVSVQVVLHCLCT